jgi:predicted AAA+ superfamily ATPase
VQKVPKLLDVVHDCIESFKTPFALTGSSSRKLKRGGGNLLAGRAISLALYPLTSIELTKDFDLDHALSFGTMPKLLEFEGEVQSIVRYLNSYVHTYIKEEILVEQLIRHLDPFRLFLPLAAQMEGEPLNYSKIARQSGVQHKTIESYYQILVETHLGHFLEAYNKSVRKVQRQAAKFYFFDTGVKRALEKKLTLRLKPKTSEYGHQFESWFINECFRLNSYLEKDFNFSYLRTKDDAEVDLIIEKPDGQIVLVEIKSTSRVDESHLKHLKHFAMDFPEAQLMCVCQVARKEIHQRILVLNWQEALIEIFAL